MMMFIFNFNIGLDLNLWQRTYEDFIALRDGLEEENSLPKHKVSDI